MDGVVNDGRLAAVKYLTGYALEKSMSIDNLIVFSVLFEAMAIPPDRRRRVLLWGLIGAVVMRGDGLKCGRFGPDSMIRRCVSARHSHPPAERHSPQGDG